MKRWVLILPLVVILAACKDDGKTCVQSHTEWMWIPIVNCYPAGKTTVCTTNLMWLPRDQCDVWVTDVPKDVTR